MGSGPRLTIALVSQKGGVGKSTIATNLGAASCKRGWRTVLVDCDPQGNLDDWKAQQPLGSPLAELKVKSVAEELTDASFRKLTAGFDVAVLDSAPKLDDLAFSVAMPSDVVVVPLRVGGFNWWASSRTVNLLDDVDRARGKLRAPRGPLRRVWVLNEVALARDGDGKPRPRTLLGQAALELLGGDAFCMSGLNHYAAAATAGESVLTCSDRTLPRRMRPREPPAAREMLALWRLVSLPALGGTDG
jgi:cellulose biosynthesis protein BcsQ